MNHFRRILIIAALSAATASLAFGQTQKVAANSKSTATTATKTGTEAMSNAEITEAVKAMARAEWASEIRDPRSIIEQSKDYASDYTEFRPECPTRLGDKDVHLRINTAGATSDSQSISAEMFNPKVQVYNGDVAILSYHYVGIDKSKDGKTQTTRAKVTRVYVKQSDNWVLVHKNVAADPLPK
jgi:ketosteroid isomerase-like protein